MISIRSGDGDCRTLFAERIELFVRENGSVTVGAISVHLRRSVRYVRSVIDETRELKMTQRGSRVSDWCIVTQCLTCGDWLDGEYDGSDQCSRHL